MNSNQSETAIAIFNKMKVHFLLQAEDSLSILNPFPDCLRDYRDGIKLAWLAISDSSEELRSKLVDYRPDNHDSFPKRCASNYDFPQSAYVAFTGEILYLIGKNESPNLYTRTPLVEEGLVCGAIEKKLACHYLKLIAAEVYGTSSQLDEYLVELKKFEETLDCDVPELKLASSDMG